jgi:hypothetical protein
MFSAGALPNRKTCRRKKVAENAAQRCKTTTALRAQRQKPDEQNTRESR